MDSEMYQTGMAAQPPAARSQPVWVTGSSDRSFRTSHCRSASAARVTTGEDGAGPPSLAYPEGLVPPRPVLLPPPEPGTAR
jgi:hypothetical protein